MALHVRLAAYSQRAIALALGLLLLASSGCGWVPQGKFAASEALNRSLMEQNRAQLAEMENIRAHSIDFEQQLHSAERELALLEEESGIQRKQLSLVKHGAGGGAALPDSVRRKMEGLTKRFPQLEFDPQTGLCKLSGDILFDSADSQLRPEDQRLLKELAYVLSMPESNDLKVMVVGHTDDQNLKRPTRQKFATNWHLSTSRSLVVAQFLRENGLEEERMGVAGFSAHQPIASNKSPDDRARNRRVEIFVLAPDTPIVGWTETIPTAYR